MKISQRRKLLAIAIFNALLGAGLVGFSILKVTRYEIKTCQLEEPLPVINDVTMEDAEYTGIKDVTNVISNGFDAPSTIPSESSSEFQHYFNKADVIISKGQGNLEGLIPLNDKRIFYLLMVKCDVMAEFLNVEKGSFVVFNNHLRERIKN